MRILFGRLRSKGGSKFQGKASAAARSSIVLRFLGGCQAEELGMFIRLLLEPLGHHAEGSCVEAVERAVGQTDVAAVLPLGRQHSLLNVITVVVDKLGHLVQAHLPRIMQIVLCISASVSAILDRREQLKPGCINPLKNLRRLGVLRVLDFFEGFESYAFSPQELDAIFQAVVWPQVCRLPTESPYSPTPLLKLIHAWSKNARCFPLLAKQRPDQPECDILLNVFSLLSAKKITAATVAVVLDIAECLVTTPDFVATEAAAALDVNGCVVPPVVEGAVVSADELSLGSRLLLPHISALLAFFSGVVGDTERTRRKKNRTRETEIDILATVQNLLRRCVDATAFLAPLSKLFSVVVNKLPRMALTKTFLRPDQPECDILLNVFSLLSAKKITAATVAVVLDIAECLVTTPDFVATEAAAALDVNGCVVPPVVEGAVVSADELSLGSRLLLPHISALLAFFSGVVGDTERTRRKKNRTRVAKELSILSK
ncbi:hypothetical protein CRUP_028585 [Coryphaenoides rupestris]|nr:hypothetical protein CRUP_028585 [Coryphaenoides rupestris]